MGIQRQSWTAVVLAAGKGTRMRSKRPKVMHGLLGMPMLGYVLDALADAGIGRTIVVIGHGSGQVEAYLRHRGVDWVLQEEQKGTGHAVLVTRRSLGGFAGRVLILCGDTPLLRGSTLKAFVAEHQRSGVDLSILSARFDDPSGYGRIVRPPGGGDSILGIVEEKDAGPSERLIDEVNTGVYAAGARDLFRWLDMVGCDNAQGEYYLTDIVALAVREGKRVLALPLAEEEEALGVNSRHELARAESVLLGRVRRFWMDRGVTFVMPDTVYIEPGVRVGRDVSIGPFSVLKGETVVGDEAELGAFCVLDNARVPRGARLAPYTLLQ